MANTNNNDNHKNMRNFFFKALKATAKAIIFYVVYLFLWNILAPISQLVPGFQQMVETFVVVYITLMIIGDLASGTIFQYFFNVAKVLFVMGYLIISSGGGIFGITFENINLMVDLRFFFAIAMLLSLLGLGKSVLQAVNYMNEKAEYGRS
ncbi:hypothetical protein HXY32_01140 [Candidatus Bathyarchaeota archaeon]|nr:hypothetical protein [Candidatus Bathyarchaeota archaeon]